MKKLLLAIFFLASSVSAQTRPVRFDFQEALYNDTCATGEFVQLRWNSHLTTDKGDIPLPNGQNLLFPKFAPDCVRFAGVGNRDDQAWEWTGSGWVIHGPAFGTNPVIYDASGNLVVVRAAGGPTGSQGYRYRADNGQLITSDESFANLSLHLWEFTCRGDLCCGQGADEDPQHGGLQCLLAGRRILVEPGTLRAVNLSRQGDLVTLGWSNFDNRSASVLRTTRGLLNQLPTFEIPGENPPPPPPPPPPQVLPDPDKAQKIVLEERKKFGSMSESQVAVFLESVAVRMNNEGLKGGPFGRLKKEGGTQCDGWACDIICSGNGDKQKQWDMMRDAEPGGVQEASWPAHSTPLPTIVIRQCVVPESEQPPPPNCDECQEKLEETESSLKAATEMIVILTETARAAQEENSKLRSEIDAQKAEIERLNRRNFTCVVEGVPGWVGIFGVKARCRVIETGPLPSHQLEPRNPRYN